MCPKKNTGLAIFGQGLVGVIICALLLAPHEANATLIQKDLFAPGDGLVIRDTSTQLDWLNLDATVFRSIDELLAGTDGPDYINELGFDFASMDQLATLWSGVGVPLSTNGTTNDLAIVNGVTQLLSLFGTTVNVYIGGDPVGETLHGLIYDDACSANFHRDASLYLLDNGLVRSSIGVLCVTNEFSGESFGVYLLRPAPAVPEPASIALVGIGLMGLWGSRRRPPFLLACSRFSSVVWRRPTVSNRPVSSVAPPLAPPCLDHTLAWSTRSPFNALFRPAAKRRSQMRLKLREK